MLPKYTTEHTTIPPTIHTTSLMHSTLAPVIESTTYDSDDNDTPALDDRHDINSDNNESDYDIPNNISTQIGNSSKRTKSITISNNTQTHPQPRDQQQLPTHIQPRDPQAPPTTPPANHTHDQQHHKENKYTSHTTPTNTKTQSPAPPALFQPYSDDLSFNDDTTKICFIVEI